VVFGGSIGIALLGSVAASETSTYLTGHAATAAAQTQAAIHGYATAYWWAAGFYAVGMVACLLLFRSKQPGAAR
jgi:uncharacterized membrane protein YdfJ with MMPL/SSD domain